MLAKSVVSILIILTENTTLYWILCKIAFLHFINSNIIDSVERYPFTMSCIQKTGIPLVF